MPAIRYQDRIFDRDRGETVLDALLRQGVPVAHACKAGSCGSCLLRASGEPPPAEAQAGLKDAWKARGYFLSCICRPAGDFVVEDADADARVAAEITSLRPLSADVLEVRLRCETPFSFRAGQYVAVVRGDGLSRSYSIATLPEEGEIGLHVRRIAGGRMSGWLFDEAAVGDRVHLQGPSGECFYLPGREPQPMLLVGTGTGLAPLWGIVRDALRCGHNGPIHLIHGALRESGLYLHEELMALAAGHPNFFYIPSVRENEPIEGVLAGRFAKLEGWRAFVCGDPGIVGGLRKRLFLAGVPMRDIHADAFLPAQPSA